MDVFFTGKRDTFFAPLNGKYREAILQGLKELYLRLNGPRADFEYLISRDDVLSIFKEALQKFPPKDNSEQTEDEEAFDNYLDLASNALRRLEVHGWIEKYRDPMKHQSTYRFTPQARSISAAISEEDKFHLKATHRNARNTLNSLRGFIDKRDIFSLLDAERSSREIINDINEQIEEIEILKQKQLHETEKELEYGEAVNSLVDYYTEKFQTGAQEILSQDSVVKYQNDIEDLLDKIEQFDKSLFTDIETELQDRYPKLKKELGIDSFLLHIIEQIRDRVRGARDYKMEELKSSVQSYVTRLHSIIRRLASIHYHGGGNKFRELCVILGSMSEEKQDEILSSVNDMDMFAGIQLLAPETIKLPKEREDRFIQSSFKSPPELSREQRKELFVAEFIRKNMDVNHEETVNYIANKLIKGQRIKLSKFLINDYKDLLANLRSSSIGSANAGMEYHFEVIPLQGRRITPYFEGDDFEIKLIEVSQDAA